MKSIAVITGASSGLGREFALQIDRDYQPQEVWLVARRQDRLEELVKELRPGVGRVFVSDLGTSQGTQALIDALEAELAQGGVLTAMVNNAGFGTYGPFAETKGDWQLEMVDLNVRSLTQLSWFAARNIQAGGFMVNVASLAGFMPLGNFAAYAATKAYVLSLSSALYAELESKGITVTALCPGPVDTEFGKVASGGKRPVVVHGKSTKDTVAHCLRAVKRRKLVAVMGLDWKFQAFLSRILGRRFVARLTWKYMPRPQDSVNKA